MMDKVEFICKVLAKTFDEPCNYGDIGEYMERNVNVFDENFCDKNCGNIEPWKCWESYLMFKYNVDKEV